MIYGLDENNEFYVECTPCTRPVGTIREEMELACQRLEHEHGNICISLSSGVDSQVLVHTFHTLGLPYRTAFLHYVGYNDNERANIDTLDKKYGIKTQVYEIEPDKHKDHVEELARQSRLPAEHHFMKMFVDSLDPEWNILQGIESFDFVWQNNICYCMESWTAIEIASQRAVNELDRPGRALAIDRRAPFNEFTLSLLDNDIVKGYVNGIEFIKNNGLVREGSNEKPKLIFGWELYVKPIIFGLYWEPGELELFPKGVSPEKIDWIMNPSEAVLRHNYINNCAFVPKDELIAHLKNFGSTEVKRWNQYKGKYYGNNT